MKDNINGFSTDNLEEKIPPAVTTFYDKLYIVYRGYDNSIWMSYLDTRQRHVDIKLK